MRLVPCSRCARHVFVSESACPHCGEGRTPAIAAAPLVGLAVGAALAAAACSQPPMAAVYGPAPVDPSARVEPSAEPTPDTPPSAAPPTSSTAAPPSPPVGVYGPAPAAVDRRQP